MKRSICLAAVACIGLAGCATSPEPQWLTDARAREAEPMPPQTIGSEDRFFRARVPAKLAGPIVRTGDIYHVQLEVGTETPIECFVYQEELDSAASLSMISSGTFEAISNVSEVDYKEIGELDAGAIVGSPFLYVDWLYRARVGDSVQVGGIKHLTAQKRGRTVHCLHNEVGYTQTFRRAVRGLIESLEYQQPRKSEPHFTQVSTLTIKGTPVGYEHVTLVRDESGTTRVDVRTALLMPVDRETIAATDSVAVEFAEPDGDLIEQVFVETENGELVTQLTLVPGSQGVWEASGMFKSKPVAAQIRPGAHPTTWLGEALTLRQALARDGIGSEVTLVRWIPGADPTHLLDETLSIEEELDQERYGARLVVAGLEAALVVDIQGSIETASIDMGFGNMDFERVYVGGDF